MIFDLILIITLFLFPIALGRLIYSTYKESSRDKSYLNSCPNCGHDWKSFPMELFDGKCLFCTDKFDRKL